MIVGNGDIASVLEDRKGALFFASGVSNSLLTYKENKDQFDRERDLLLAQDNKLCIFYFSSILAPSCANDYYRHKFKMEMLIKSNFNHYNILRLGNIDWGKNPNTFLNYLRARKRNGEALIMRDEVKYMIDQDTLVMLTSCLPLKGQNVLNVFSYQGKVIDLV